MPSIPQFMPLVPGQQAQEQDCPAAPVIPSPAGTPRNTTDIIAPSVSPTWKNRVDTLAEFAQNALAGADAHRIVPHRYEVRSIAQEINPNTGRLRNTSVAGVFDTQANVNAKTGVARGQFELRFDQAHGYRGGTIGPHVNVGTGEHIAVEVPQALVAGAGFGARTLEGVDRVVVPAGIAVDTLRVVNALSQDGGKVGGETMRTARGIAGGWAGALAGASAGAEIGAAAGVIGGPPGSALGAVAGGLVGGVAGSFAGSTLAERVGS